MTKALLLLAFIGANVSAQRREIRPEDFVTGTLTKIERLHGHLHYTIKTGRATYVAWPPEALRLTEGSEVRFAIYLGDDKHALYIIDDDGKTQETPFYQPGVALTPNGVILHASLGLGEHFGG